MRKKKYSVSAILDTIVTYVILIAKALFSCSRYSGWSWLPF